MNSSDETLTTTSYKEFIEVIIALKMNGYEPFTQFNDGFMCKCANRMLTTIFQKRNAKHELLALATVELVE